jgi:aminopeptidase N
VYEKGAEVIRMIHTLLGEKNYRKATDLYFESFDGQAVTTDDFLWAMAKAGEIDLEQFKLWYHQSATPRLEVKESFNDGVYSLSLTQNIPNSVDGTKQKPYFYPLKIALFDRNGVEVISQTLHISQKNESFVFEGFKEKPILSINRDFSAPIIIEQESVAYAFLMKYDTNSFTQYEAAQNFAVDTLESMMKGAEIDEEYIEAYGHLLALDVDLSYKALLLELPSISTLMQRQDEVDFEPLYEVKEKLEKELAQRYKTKLVSIYNEYHQANNEKVDALSISYRAIKNRVLRILCSLEDKEFIELAYKQYEESLTMTDRIVALDILENSDQTLAKKAQKDFYEKYKNDTLVMNKYFAILAASQREGTLSRVKALQSDEVYDEKVPNLVRSLIGVFARNYKHFHAKDGEGYTFVADKIIEIDKINPQMASGLAGAFKICDKMNKYNKSVIKEQLIRVVSTQSLSKNTFEIINKILKKD